MKQWALLNNSSFEYRAQQLFVDMRGYIIESDDRLFSTLHLKETAIFQWLPLLESLWDSLLSDEINDNSEVIFERMCPQTTTLPGMYDFSFIKAEWAGQMLIVWSITDITDTYETIAKEQQRRNEANIKDEQKLK